MQLLEVAVLLTLLQDHRPGKISRIVHPQVLLILQQNDRTYTYVLRGSASSVLPMLLQDDRPDESCRMIHQQVEIDYYLRLPQDVRPGTGRIHDGEERLVTQTTAVLGRVYDYRVYL